MPMTNEELREAIEQTAARLAPPGFGMKLLPDSAMAALIQHLDLLQKEELRRATEVVDTRPSP